MEIMPPMNSINNVLRVRAEVAIKLVTKLCGLRCSKGSHVFKNVITFDDCAAAHVACK